MACYNIPMNYFYNIIVLFILNQRDLFRNYVFSFIIVDKNNVLRNSIYTKTTQNNKSIFQQRQMLPNEKKAISKTSFASPNTPLTIRGENKIESNNTTGNNDDNDDDAFVVLSSIVYNCLKESDKRRDAKRENETNNSPAGATNWIDEKSAFLVQQIMNKVSLKLPEEHTNGYDRDEASIWLRWLKLSPTPLIIDISKEIRDTIKKSSSLSSPDDDEEKINRLNRITCKLYILPSGMTLSNNIITSVGSMYYGKLLYGGVKRYRIINSSSSSSKQRRSTERVAIKSTINDNIPCWIQYGGSKRNYESLDIGPACILEIGVLPLHSVDNDPSSFSATSTTTTNNNDMNIDNFLWNPKNMFHFHNDNTNKAQQEESNNNDSNNMLPSMLSGTNRNEAFTTTFESRVGGLQNQIEAIVRRVLDGRVIRPVLSYDDDEYDDTNHNSNDDDDDDEYFKELKNTKLEADELSLLGLSPVRGLLLYGPPGCGKTVLAREISYALQARKPKIVSAPELLDRWVGGSERLIRDLFSDAEAELSSVNGDASKSALHVIVIDEIDAVFRKRSSSIQQDSGEATRSSAVNQILAKLDGVNAIPNVLLIGMTNRRELLDDALLRPGRLEVQIHIPLPDKEGRRDILKIHFDLLRKKGRLSLPLCMAIDGPDQSDFITTTTATANNKRKIIKQTFKNIVQYTSKPPLSLSLSKKHRTNNFYNDINNFDDLASDLVTGGFSGADIAGLVRCAGSIALARARNDGSGIDGLLITLEDVMLALKEVKGI